MQERSLPQRTCVCCRKKTVKSSLVRLHAEDGVIVRDRDGSKKSRGTYVCADCFAAGGKPLIKALSRAFRRQITESEADGLR